MTSDRGDMTPLAALIREVQRAFTDRHGVELSNGDIAKRSGGRLTRQRVQQLSTRPIPTMPSPATLRALALGLQVPYSVVLQRALASCGYDESYVPRGVPDVPAMTAEQEREHYRAAALRTVDQPVTVRDE